MLQRVIRGAAADARLGLGAAPTAATVTITRANGDVIVTDGDATETADGASYPLSAVELADVDMLTAVWTVDGETHRTFVEVVGGFLVSLAALRKVDPLGDAAEYTDDDLERARLVAETALEDAAGVAFATRYRRLRLDGTGASDLLVMPEVRRVRAASVDGTALTEDELDELVTYEDEGLVYRPDGWACGRRNVVLDVEHGYEFVPPRVAEAVKPLARHVLVDSPVDERAISTTNEDGLVQVFVQPGIRGAVFAYPEANAVVQQYGYRGVV